MVMRRQVQFWVTGTVLIALLALLLLGCSPPMPRVAVEGDPGWIAALAGRWEGTYESETTGREGVLAFELSAAGDTARGEILMMPAWTDEPFQGSNRGEPREPRTVRPPKPLQIHFVRIEEGQVLGRLDPYTDPNCRCEVRTSFIGSIDGDEIRGIFAIRGLKTWLAFGEWRAHRVRSASSSPMVFDWRQP